MKLMDFFENIYSSPLNNLDLNCPGPLMWLISVYYSTTLQDLQWVESVDKERGLKKDPLQSYKWIFYCTGVGAPDSCIVQRSAAFFFKETAKLFSKVSAPLIFFFKNKFLNIEK